MAGGEIAEVPSAGSRSEGGHVLPVSIAINVNIKIYLNILADIAVRMEQQVKILIVGKGLDRLEIESTIAGVSLFIKGFINASCCAIMSVTTGRGREQCALTSSPS